MKKLILTALSFLLFAGCKIDFEQIGEFSIKYLDNGCKEVTDGIGKKFLLVPEGGKVQKSSGQANIIKIPVKKVVVYSMYNAALIKALAHVDSIAGVITKKEDWYIPEIIEGIENGKIAYLGEYTAIDYERLKVIKPDVVFTWDEGIVPKLNELSIPCVVTSTKIAQDLDAHIDFIKFVAAFYSEEEKGKEFAVSQFKRINKISDTLKVVNTRPKVVWGDIYERKVLVEPGNSWAGQIVEKAGGDYLFHDLEGASCMQVTLEKFFSRTKDADILITYRGPKSGITSKENLRKSSRLLQTVDIKPMNKGKIYFTGYRLYQSADIAGIVEELASLFHPGLFPGHKKPEYFFELPGR